LTDAHFAVADEHAHHVASGHEEKHEPAGFIHCVFEPTVDRGSFANVVFHPAHGAVAIPAANKVEGYSRSQNA
jgi:hypothetical protein